MCRGTTLKYSMCNREAYLNIYHAFSSSKWNTRLFAFLFPIDGLVWINRAGFSCILKRLVNANALSRKSLGYIDDVTLWITREYTIPHTRAHNQLAFLETLENLLSCYVPLTFPAKEENWRLYRGIIHRWILSNVTSVYTSPVTSAINNCTEKLNGLTQSRKRRKDCSIAKLLLLIT